MHFKKYEVTSKLEKNDKNIKKKPTKTQKLWFAKGINICEKSSNGFKESFIEQKSHGLITIKKHNKQTTDVNSHFSQQQVTGRPGWGGCAGLHSGHHSHKQSGQGQLM